MTVDRTGEDRRIPPARRPLGLRPVAGLAALLAVAGAGCGSTRTTQTARTGTEQLLLTNAWDKAILRVDFRPLTGVPVFLDTANVTAIDQGWVVSSLREAMLTQGVLLREKRESAQYIVEARVGAYGTDDDDFMLGVKQTTIPPTLTGVPTGTIPEMSLFKRNRQQAVAKLALFAYDRATGQFVWRSGTMLDKADNKDVFVGGFGPINSGSIHDGTEIAGIKLPLPADKSAPPEPFADPPADRKSRWKDRDRPYNPPAVQTPSNFSDLDSFKP